ncbi:MAG TPA: cytochrome-c oxidase, cbb3-type subunit III [Candidatus Desulfobacillus sp.]|nr:cytochrome-c oxidase, cbb3-type subunit III [Candidatus Desulfobacillus sp.]
MSSGWSLWVMALVVINMGVIFFLFLWAPRARVPTLPDGTTGHSWAHGEIREGMHRLPLWWILGSFAMFISAFTYLTLFPGFGGNHGLLQWTAHGELAKNVEQNKARLDPLLARLTAMSVEQAAADPQALHLGERLFVDNCAACHGRNAHGNPLLGAPNLTDDDWLYGGSGEAIKTSIHDGRNGVMPPWNALGEETVKNLAQYVLGLSGQPHDAAMAAKAEETFKGTCSACHGVDGKGNQGIGAPNLTDKIWLYGGSQAAIEETIRNGRQGQMPTWSARLPDADIHVLAAYVYHLSHRGETAAK